MYADFRSATSGTGKSFKGALDYFLNDKGLDQERPTTDERVDVLELRNLATDNARNAWFEMMSTAQASEALKEAAGIKRGGRVGTNPVFTYHLAWHDSERPDRAAMLDAARSTLKLLGLENHQALIVSHTDTAHPHVHVIVNRVNPEDGRYAALSNSWKLLKGWAIEYSRERGTTWHLPLEQAKEAREQRKQTERQAGFNRAVQGKPPEQIKPAPRQKAPSRAEWQARKGTDRGSNPAEVAAAATLKAGLAGKWATLRQFERQTAEKQQAERSRLWEDRKAYRDAIFEKYAEANKAIWAPDPPSAKVGARPSPLSETVRQVLSSRRRQFEKGERSFIGTVANAEWLGKGQSFFAIIRLAFNSGERRRLFDIEQRKIAAQGRQFVEQKTRAAWVPETRRMRADRLKAMRAHELAGFDRMTGILRNELAEKHQLQTAGLAAMKTALAASGREAWAGHAAAFRGSNMRGNRQEPTQEQTTERAQPKEATPDRFGRSRDRKPRQPRAERQERAGQGEGRADTRTGTEQPHSGPQTGRRAGEAFREATAAPEAPEGARSSLDRAEAAYVRSDEQKAAYERVKAHRAAEREANERSDDRGLEREL